MGRWRGAIDRCDGGQRTEFDPRPCRRRIIDDHHHHTTGDSSTAHNELTARICHYHHNHHNVRDPSTGYPDATARHTRHDVFTACYVVNAHHDTVVWWRLPSRIVGDSGGCFMRNIHRGLSRGRIGRKPSRPCLRGKRSGRRIGLGS